jgi:hypothetical protein
MIADPPPLPPGWTAHAGPNSTTYYYHAETRTSTWILPTTTTTTTTVNTTNNKRPRSLSALNESMVQASPMRHRAHLEAIREHLVERLSQRDSILEPDSEITLRQWLAVAEELGMRDAAKEASTLLSSNYAGSGDMVFLLESWLDVVKPGLGKQTSLQHVREVIRQKFDRSVDALDELLVKHDRPPLWLVSLLASKEWRALLVNLAEKHRASPFLSFCVKAMAQSGFQAEIAASAFASSHFTVFKQSLGEALARVMDALVASPQQQDKCAVAEDAFLRIADSSLLAHAFATELLLEMEKADRGLPPGMRAVATRLRQRFQTPLVMDPLLRRSKGSLALTHPEVALLLKKVAKGEADVCGEAGLILHKHYTASGTALAFLREKPVLDRMASSLYLPYRPAPLTPEVRTAASYLLALACTSLSPPQDLVSAIESTSLLCGKEDSLSIANVEDCIRTGLRPFVLAHPTVSMGFLFWMKMVFTHSAFLTSLVFPSAVTAMCALVAEVVAKHAMQHSHCLAVLRLVFHADAKNVSQNQRDQVTVACIEAMVSLVASGYATPVVHFMYEVKLQIDNSHLRKFVQSVMMMNNNTKHGESFRSAMKELLDFVLDHKIIDRKAVEDMLVKLGQ